MALAMLAAAVCGCAPRGASSRSAVAPAAAAVAEPAAHVAVERREVELSDGWIKVTIDTPADVSGPMPVIIRPLGRRIDLITLGFVLVDYRLAWEKLRDLRPAPPPSRPEGRRDETVGVWLLTSPHRGVIGQGYFGLIWAEALALPKVLDHLETLPEVDVRRVGIGGASTNGFKALSSLLIEPRVRAAVVVAACGDYHDFLQHSSLAMKGEPLRLDRDYERWLVEREPVRRAAEFTDVALLMVNGGADHAVPASCALRTRDVLRAAYADAGRADHFRFLWYEGAGHVGLTELAEAEIAAWWKRWLVDTPGR